MALRTFDTDTTIIEAPLGSVSLTDDSQLRIEVVDNTRNISIKSRTISASDILDISNNFDLVVENSDNPYTLNFYRNIFGDLNKSEVVYKIYENVELSNGSSERILVSQFTVNSEINNGEFKYYITVDKNDTSRVNLSFGDKVESQRYDAGNSIELSVQSLSYNATIDRTISISYDDKYESAIREFDKSSVKESISNSIDDNLSISGSLSDGSVSIVNQNITESERFLKFGVITDEGDNLLVTNWVDGGTLNQLDDEIEPLGSVVLKLYNQATPLSVKDVVTFTELYANDIIIEADLSEGEEGFGLNQLTPNFQKEVEENTISTFSDYQSFNELTLSGSSLQDRIIDHFLQRKQDAVGLNTDFTNFNNFVKFSSAEERLVNFHYKVTELERLTTASASLSASNATSSLSASFVSNRSQDLQEEIRGIKNSFDEYEQFLYSDSGSLYENKPYVSSSDNVFASWPKSTPTEEITNGGFDTTNNWGVSGSNSTISNNFARIYQHGQVSQSVDLIPDREYILTFDVKNNGLPVSFEYNGKTIVNETVFPSGSNEFEFTTRNLQNSDDIFEINGADYGDGTRFTDIDNVSIKEKSVLLDSDSTEVESWFNEFKEIAKDYDARNKDSLRNNTPEYIRSDSANDDYILFLDMIGQMFDEIWLYGNELGNLYDWDNDISQGLSEDLSIVLLEAYGNNLDVGFSEKDVWEYILGVDKNEDGIGRQVGFSFEQRQKETIRRLLVNLPYFLKNKGTGRSIKGLVLSYGIPLSTMFIREYGTFQGVEGLESIFTRETETKKVNFSGSLLDARTSNLTGSFLDPSNAIEFNIQFSQYTGNSVQLISGSDADEGGGFTISTTADGDSSGSFVLNISTGSDSYQLTSSVGPIYNGEFWNVLTQRTDSGSYEIRAYQFDRDDGEYNYELTGTGVITGSISASLDEAYLGNNRIQFKGFEGYLDEWRIWNTSFSDDIFREHVKFPTSIKLDDPLQIPNSLLVRVDISSDDGRYSAISENRLPNLVFNPTYPTQVTASGFETGDFVTYTRTDYINSTNVGNEKLANNKVRFQVTQSLNGGVLTPNFDGTNESNESVTNVDDSYKLTIGFSPTDITNEIILQHFGGNDLLDEFGDPRNTYEERYPELQRTVESFFENVSVNTKAQFFIEYIRNFDKTLFENIKKFVPERADLSTSIFIEPHYLNRSKAKRLGQSETEDLYKEGNEVEQTYEVSSTSNTEENTSNPLVTTDEENLVADVLSETNVNEAISVISQDEVVDYLNQSTDVIILQDGFESQVLQNNVWESDSSIVVRNKYGEKFRFKVYKFDYSTELEELEAEIGNYISNSDLDYIDPETGDKKYESDQKYSDLTRLWDRYYELHNTLFLLDYNANPVDNAVLVTYEDLPQWLKDSLVLSTGTTQTNKTVTKNGITYIVSDDTIDGGSVVEVTKVGDTRTIVQDPDGDVKLTVE